MIKNDTTAIFGPAQRLRYISQKPTNGKFTVRGKAFRFSDDPRNIYHQARLAGHLVLVESGRVAVLGELRAQYRGREDSLETFISLPLSDYLEPIETITFNEDGTVRVANRTYKGRYFSLALVSPSYGTFEDQGRRLVEENAVSYGFGCFTFHLPLRNYNPLTQAAENGSLLMRGGPRADISFTNVETGESLCTIPLNGHGHFDQQGRIVDTHIRGSYPLAQFTPLVQQDSFRPISKAIPQDCSRIEVNYIRYTLAGDHEMRTVIQAGGYSLEVYEDQVVLSNGFRQLTVQLDQEGYVLGSDGQRYQNTNGDYIRINQPEQKELQHFNFLEVALKRDAGIFRAAQSVELSALAELIAEGTFCEDDLYMVKLNIPPDERGLRFSIKGEEVPLDSHSFSENRLRSQDYDLVLSKTAGKTYLSLYKAEDHRHITSWEYLPELNRFAHYCPRDNNSRVEFHIVEAVPEDQVITRYGGKYYLNSAFKAGNILYLHRDQQGILQALNRDLVPYERRPIVADNREVVYLWGSDRNGKVLDQMTGWVEDILLISMSAKKSPDELAVAFGPKRFIILPREVVRTFNLKAGDRIDVYGEKGIGSRLRIKGTTINLKTIRDRQGTIRDAAARTLKQGLFEDEPSFVYNHRPQIAKMEGTKLGVVVKRKFFPFFALGENSSHMRPRFFGNQTYSFVALPTGEVVYWTNQKSFNKLDQKIAEVALCAVENRDQFETEAAKINGDKTALRQRNIALNYLSQLEDSPNLVSLRRAHHVLETALEAFPYQEDLLEQLLEIRGKLIVNQACHDRKGAIYRDLYKIVVEQRANPTKVTNNVMAYLADPALTPLETAFALEVIWEAANGQLFGHMLAFQRLLSNLRENTNFFSQKKTKIALRGLAKKGTKQRYMANYMSTTTSRKL